MEKVIKPSTSFVDYNMVENNPEKYILLGFSNKKCICTIHHEDCWYAYFSSDHEDGEYDYEDELDPLIEQLSLKYNNFELMCEKVE